MVQLVMVHTSSLMRIGVISTFVQQKPPGFWSLDVLEHGFVPLEQELRASKRLDKAP